MNSSELTRDGWKKFTNPSGEVIRKKTYVRTLISWDNLSPRELVAEREKLAEILQVPIEDIVYDLEITVICNRYPKHKRLTRYFNQKEK